MIVAQFMQETLEANSFVVACPETREAALVDTGDFDARVHGFLEAQRLLLRLILITHDHYDHSTALPSYLKTFPGVAAYSCNGRIAGCRTLSLEHGSALNIGNAEGRIVHTPGHTPDGVTWILPGLAFTGDALFSGSVGGTSSPEEYERQITAVREHIFCLPDDTQLHVGHGPSTTVGIEKRFNPFFG